MTSQQSEQQPPFTPTSSVDNPPAAPWTLTPPPSQKAIHANFGSSEVTTQPSFEEFSVKPNQLAPAVPLNPDSPILNSKIQEITAEEFGQTITAAQQVTEGLCKLNLPRSWKELVDTLDQSITSTKRKFKETGKIPNEEAIKIQTGRIGGGSPLTSTAALKQPAKKIQTTKLVDYLTKNTKTASSHHPLHLKHTNPGAAPNSQGAANSNPSQQDPPDNSAAPAVPACSHVSSPQHNVPISEPDPHVPTPADWPANKDPQKDQPKSTTPNPPNALANHAFPTNSNPSLASGQNGDNATAATASTSNDPTSAPSQSLHANPHPSMSSDDPPNSSSTAPSNGDPTQPSQTSPKPLSILRSDDAKLHVILLYWEVKGSKPSWDKYQKTWSCLGHLVKFCAQSLQTATPETSDFHFQRTSCSYSSWIKTIASLAGDFLSPSHNDQWYCPDIINFPLLDAFVSISEWVKVVAASVELMAKNLFRLPPPTPNHDDDKLIEGLQVLQHIDQIKNLSSSFATIEEDPASDSASTKRSHLKKANSRSNWNNAQSSSGTVIETGKDSSELIKKQEESVRQLQDYQRRQNFQPLVFFVVAGVRGLFLATQNHRQAVLTNCMSFIQAMKFITQHSTALHTPEEPIWKNLSAYIVKKFSPIFHSPNKISPLIKLPTGQEIAEAITTDFLNHWQTSQPSSPFFIPHSTCQIQDS
ncbi:hypothetical protein PCANC_23955 [Puccinia coronata f. sp. avenae]|uniref:Uncharacterized protein n=1 Tax=Puccinia coronata f. sp. avenae TaxID=200324 RepID=A0A2N5S3V9_9BASI|nr:hypothetical protein PCANC_23955 [Puccinia coronata f. sp. avenae]